MSSGFNHTRTSTRSGPSRLRVVTDAEAANAPLDSDDGTDDVDVPPAPAVGAAVREGEGRVDNGVVHRVAHRRQLSFVAQGMSPVAGTAPLPTMLPIRVTYHGAVDMSRPHKAGLGPGL